MPEDIMLRARRSMSDRERDVTRFLSELHRRIEETADAGARPCARRSPSSTRREKEMAREWEKRETAKLKELERRTDEALANFEEQAQDAIGQIAQSGEHARPSRTRSAGLPKPNASCARTFRPPCFPPQDDSRAGQHPAAQGSRRARASACATCASRRACGACSAATASRSKPAS